VIFSFAIPVQAQIYSIGTSPQGSLFYSSAAALATLMVQKTGAQYRIAPYGGSSTFLPLVDKGELAYGMANGGESAFAYGGVEIFKEPRKKICAWLEHFTRIWAVIWCKPILPTRPLRI